MNNLFQLTKAAFFTNFTIGQTKKQKRGFFATVGLIGLILFIVSCFYNYTYSMLFAMEDAMDEYLILMFLLAGMISMMLSIFKMQSAIFKTSDYEFLESLPVSKKTIVASKILSIYLLTFFEDIIICLPAIVFYGVETLNIYGCIVAFIGMFFVSLIPLLVASVISFLFALIGSKFKKSNIVTILLYLVMVLCVLFLSISLPSEQDSLGFEAIKELFGVMPQLMLLYESLSVVKWYYFVLFIVLNVLSMALVVLLISGAYSKINSSYRYSSVRKKYTTEQVKDISIEKNLFIKEWKLITSNAMYFVNSFLGSFMGGFIAVVFYFSLNSMMAESGVSPNEIEEIRGLFINIIPMAFIFFNFIATSTSASISFEKGNFSALKSYPLSISQIINAKLKVAIVVPVIMNIISIIISLILFDFHWAIIIEIAVLPTLACVLNAIVGMLCGLKWAKFDYVNDTQIFKNSMATGMTMFFGFVLSLFIIASTILNFINPIIGLIVSGSVIIILIVGAFLLLRKVQKPWFERLVN